MNTDNIDESQQVLSPAARALIREHIRTIEQLDILLWLRSRPLGEHELDCVAVALGLGPTVAAAAVAHLSRLEAVIVTSESPLRVRYAPRSSRLDEAVAQLGERYTLSRVHALTFISSCAIERASNAQRASVAGSVKRTAKPSR